VRVDHSHEKALSDRGFTLLELLIACAMLLAVAGAVATMAAPLRDVFERSLGTTEMAGGSRVALDRVIADIREAASAASVGVPQICFSRVFPTVAVLSDLGASPALGAGRALRISRIPLQAAQGVLRLDAVGGTTTLALDTAARCSAVGRACGFRSGTLAVLHDATRSLPVTVDSVTGAGLVRLTSGLTMAFAAGSVLAAVTVTEYGVRPDPDGSFRLVRIVSGVEQPLLQHVVHFEAVANGPDAFRIERVDLRLRLEAASAAHRGPSTVLFRRPGTSRHATRWVPDVEISTSASPRSPAS
jgi:prepilin-type N-terminal cleavage/methylation domain-containing protein